jgi:hypothetical protein
MESVESVKSVDERKEQEANYWKLEIGNWKLEIDDGGMR